MLRRISIVVLLFALAAGLAAADERSFGAPLSPDLAVTAIGDIVADPDAWAGKRVRIEGRVSGVCEHMGCWLELASPDDVALRVKVDDGVIVFPSDAVGAHAEAEGEVEILELTRDEYEDWLRHQAEETGDEFDPAAVGDGPYRIVRLRGLGAVVTGP